MHTTEHHNVLLVVMDTTRIKNLSCYGYEKQTTPALEQVAAEGVLFENCFAPAPWTPPSHASLFTGLFPSRHGVDHGHLYLRPDIPTLAEVLRAHGYRTVGYSNNSLVCHELGMTRGFESFTEMGQKASTFRGSGLARIKLQLKDQVPGLYGTLVRLKHRLRQSASDKGAHRTTSEIMDWLTRYGKHGRSFFVFVNYSEPHLPYRRPNHPFDRRFLDSDIGTVEVSNVNQEALKLISGEAQMNPRDFRILEGLYNGAVAYLDQKIGELLDFLRSCDLLDQTLLIITSDHGENIGDHGLMDHQHCLYDTLLRVPLLIRYPPIFGADTRRDDFVQLTDLMPTILELLKIAKPSCQGQSFLTRLGRQFVYAECESPAPPMRGEKGDGLIADFDVSPFDRRLKAIRGREYKYIWASDGRCELYNTRKDPNERDNLIEKELDKAKELHDLLHEWSNGFALPQFSGKEPEVDEVVLERLRALGYLQSNLDRHWSGQ